MCMEQTFQSTISRSLEMYPVRHGICASIHVSWVPELLRNSTSLLKAVQQRMWKVLGLLFGLAGGMTWKKEQSGYLHHEDAALKSMC